MLIDHIFSWYFMIAGVSGVPVNWGPFESQPMCEYVRSAIMRILPEGDYTPCTNQYMPPQKVD